MTHGNRQAEASGAVGLAHLLASRRARAHEIADRVDRGPSGARSPASKRTAGALALASAAAAAKRSRPNPVSSAPAAPTPSAPPPSLIATREPVRMMARRATSTVRVSPSLRWRCQHFLVSSLLRTPLAPVAAAIDPWTDADLCRARPMGCTDVGVAYCREAEEAIYRETDGRPAAYEAAVRRIAYALRRAGARFSQTRLWRHTALGRPRRRRARGQHGARTATATGTPTNGRVPRDDGRRRHLWRRAGGRRAVSQVRRRRHCQKPTPDARRRRAHDRL
ncbi:transcription elongation factor S-II [Pandoravirus inopinatum]|uniref:Transcription elongation factor S-II n=1 Tax=Pandoravirus inopinatum TaxID=1605721 RepID=A0A0B5JDS2_9VIRU|nr:transcription elongation factor S-II [Pandoravirus inopinatum]AJF97887.1 transcription elongation factor S-II [Pandoravirus inopinatum]